MRTIRYVLDEGAKEPTKAHSTDSGWDVYVRANGDDCKEFILASLKNEEGKEDPKFVKIPLSTGLHVQPPRGYYFELFPNSRLAKTSFMYSNSVGIIDESYTGEIKVVLNYIPNGQVDSDIAFLEGVLRQERPIGQLVLRKRVCCVWEKVERLNETGRGDGGFGSSENGNKKTTGQNLPSGITKVTHTVAGKTYTYYHVRAAKHKVLFHYVVKASDEDIMLKVAETLNNHVRRGIKNICKLYDGKTEQAKTELEKFFSSLYKAIEETGDVEFCNNLKTENDHE